MDHPRFAPLNMSNSLKTCAVPDRLFLNFTLTARLCLCSKKLTFCSTTFREKGTMAALFLEKRAVISIYRASYRDHPRCVVSPSRAYFSTAFQRAQVSLCYYSSFLYTDLSLYPKTFRHKAYSLSSH